MSTLLHLLTAIMSVDNQHRNAAEAQLVKLTEANASSTALSLLEVMGSQNVSSRCNTMR